MHRQEGLVRSDAVAPANRSRHAAVSPHESSAPIGRLALRGVR